jgi:hypothetical protein
LILGVCYSLENLKLTDVSGSVQMLSALQLRLWAPLALSPAAAAALNWFKSGLNWFRTELV